MEEVFASIPFLERLGDDELYRLCNTSRDYKQICENYISGRVRDRYGINVDSLKDFEIFALYSGDEITLMDALLRSILEGREDVEAYFRALGEEKYGSKCNDFPAFVSMVGYAMSGDLESLISLIDKCSPDGYTLTFLHLIAQLEDQEDIVAFLKGKIRPLSREFQVEVMTNDLPSADIIGYVIRNKNRIPSTRLDVGNLLNANMLNAIKSNAQSLKPLLKLASRYGVEPETDLIALIAMRKLVEREVLDRLITPYNFDSILRDIIRRVSLTSIRGTRPEVPPVSYQGTTRGRPEVSPLSYITDLLRRYSRYLGFESRAKGGILSVLNFLFNPAKRFGEVTYITRIDTLEDIRELVEAMLESDDRSTSQLGRYIVGLDVPSDQYVEELAEKILTEEYWFIFLLLAAFDNLPLTKAILNEIPEDSLIAGKIEEALSIANYAEHEDLARYLSDVVERILTSHGVRTRYKRRIRTGEPFRSERHPPQEPFRFSPEMRARLESRARIRTSGETPSRRNTRR